MNREGMFGEWYISKFVSKGYKVIDINSESRGEGFYYGLKQTDSGFVSRINFLSNDYLKPTTYKNEMIMFLGHNLKKIKKLPKCITVAVFNEQWLTNDDLKRFLAFNENQSSLLDGIFELNDNKKVVLSGLYKFLSNAGKDKTSPEGKALNRIGAHYMSVNTIKRTARTLLMSGLFYNDKEDLEQHFEYLDLEKTMKQKDMITTFSTYLIEDQYIRYVCIDILMKKFIELVEMRKHKTPILFYIREANDFYYMKKPPAYVIGIQNNIEKMLRKGRSFGASKVTVVMDTQLLDDVPDSVFNGFNKFVCFRLPTSDSKKLLRKATINQIYLQKLAGCNVGMGMYVSGGEFEYPLLFYPTLTAKADPNKDVFSSLSKLFGVNNFEESNFLGLNLDDDKIEVEFPILGGSKMKKVEEKKIEGVRYI